MATFTYLVFTPPTIQRRAGTGGLFGRMSFPVGQTLLRTGEFYRLVEDPSEAELAAADAAYIGGHRYYLRDQAEIDRLVANGYGDYLAPIERRLYGTGLYGENNYGPIYT